MIFNKVIWNSIILVCSLCCNQNLFAFEICVTRTDLLSSMYPVFFIVMHKWANENILCKFLALMQFSASWYVFLQYQMWPVWCNKVERSRNAVCNVLSLHPLELMQFTCLSHLQNVTIYVDFTSSLCESTTAECISYLNILIGYLLGASWFLYQNISDLDSILCSDIWDLCGAPMKNAAMRSGSNVPASGSKGERLILLVNCYQTT
jgi:hypothetical protein